MINYSFNFENFVINEAVFKQSFKLIFMVKNEQFTRFKHFVFGHYSY
jgi:hypothetical protein